MNNIIKVLKIPGHEIKEYIQPRKNGSKPKDVQMTFDLELKTKDQASKN